MIEVSMGMSGEEALLEELEELSRRSEISRRAEVLRRVTDLFVSGCDLFTDEQIELFDVVMSRLVREIDASARARLGNRLVAISNSPLGVLRMLALDDEIDVAEPVLRHSEQLDDATLVESARTKSQDHLYAIAHRRTLSESVTDVLVERGDQRVARKTAENAGARFSELGYSRLVERSESDVELAVRVWLRAEIPRQHLLQLFADASETVRARLAAEDAGKADIYRELVAKASNELQAAARKRSAEYAAAASRVRSLHEVGDLSEGRLADFARQNLFDETTLALSYMCDLPIGVVERSMTRSNSHQILILSKAIGLSWGTVAHILALKSRTKSVPPAETDLLSSMYNKLKKETALKAIRFYRLRELAMTSAAQ